MHHPALSLLALQDRTRGRPDDRELVGQRAIAGFGLAGTMSVVMLLAGLPMVSMAIVALATTAYIVATKAAAAARALRSAALPPPEAIAAFDLRESYRAVLALYEEVERGIASTRRLRSAIDPMLERCMAAVELCGRMALLSNPLEHHLDVHDPRVLRVEIERLNARCAAITDEESARVVRATIAARMRELANLEQMMVMRERIAARLELCRATLAAFSATIMKLHIADEEQAAIAAGSVAEHLENVSDKLEILESVLGVEPEPIAMLPAAASAAATVSGAAETVATTSSAGQTTAAKTTSSAGETTAAKTTSSAGEAAAATTASPAAPAASETPAAKTTSTASETPAAKTTSTASETPPASTTSAVC
jgi:hypothetical protein